MRILFIGLGAVTVATGSPSVAQQQQSAATPKPITRSQLMSRIDSAFAAVDTNHDGFLSASELQAAQGKELQQVQAQARAKMQAEFAHLDTNKDGKLSFDEFAAIATIRPSQTAEQMLQRADANHDGKISPDEFKAPQLATFNRVDTNHDGTLSVDEQRAAMTRR